MTEKRFIIDDDGIVTDMIDLSMYIDNDDCCEKLNELNDENEQLKSALSELKGISDYQASRIIELTSKNKDLEKGILDCIFDNKSLQIFAEKMGLIE